MPNRAARSNSTSLRMYPIHGHNCNLAAFEIAGRWGPDAGGPIERFGPRRTTLPVV